VVAGAATRFVTVVGRRGSLMPARACETCLQRVTAAQGSHMAQAASGFQPGLGKAGLQPVRGTSTGLPGAQRAGQGPGDDGGWPWERCLQSLGWGRALLALPECARGVGDAGGGEPFGVLLLHAQRGKGLFQPGHFAEPGALAGLGDPLGEVVLEFVHQWEAAGLGAQHGAADAGVLVRAGGAVGAVAVAVGDFPQGEVLFECVPFGLGGLTVFLSGPVLAPGLDERLVGADDLVGVDGGVGAGGVQRTVTEDRGGDVDGQAGADGLGGEEPTEVVGGEPQRRAVGVADGVAVEDPLDALADRLGLKTWWPEPIGRWNRCGSGGP
jgi:hypothetical protein